MVPKLSSTHLQPMHARCTNIENDKTTSIHKVRLPEALSRLCKSNYNNHFSVAHLQPFSAHTRLSFVTIEVSHKAYLLSVCSSSATSDTKSGSRATSLDGSSMCNVGNFYFRSIKVIPLFRYSVIPYSAFYSVPIYTDMPWKLRMSNTQGVTGSYIPVTIANPN